MEIVCIDKRTFDELVVRLSMIEKKITGICSQTKDAGLKKWMDNQEVCGTLRISKRTLQIYREKGLLPFTRIKNKFFYKPEDVQSLLDSSTNRKMYKACWNQVITHKKESHELRSYKQKRPEN